jgi:serine phosphatase RsbU (regulator of sigma subunit)
LAVFVGPPLLEAVAVLSSLNQPLGFDYHVVLALVFTLLATFVVVLWCILHSFRTVREAAARAQLRWMLFAVVLSNVVPNLLGLVNVGFLGTYPVLAAIQPWLSTSFPIAMAIAILRYRLFAIDVIINRALVYGPLTIGLVGIYFAGVAILQQIFRSVTGQTSELAIVLSTLAIAALFSPARSRVQDFVDRSFYRRKYDATQTVAAFGESVRDLVSVAELTPRLIGVVTETMQPKPVFLWLEDDLSGKGDVEPSQMASLIATDDPLRSQLVASPRATRVQQLDPTSPAARALEAQDIELVVPLAERNHLLGLLNLGRRLSGRDYSGDDRRLLDTVARQAVAVLRFARLVEAQRRDARQLERNEQDLQLAREVQQALLPRVLPRLDGWAVAAYYQPARNVGGDFYDFLELPGGRVGIAVGDVARSGVSAALLMASARSTLRPVVRQLESPGAILSQVNDLLCPDMPPMMFVTCLCASLDPSTGHLRYASAGHVMPYRRSPSTVTELRVGDLPLGIKAGMRYEDHEITIEPGSTIIFYTDGLVEARNPRGEFFGFDRLRRLVADHPSVDGLIVAIRRALAEFCGGEANQEDDLAVVVLQRHEGMEENGRTSTAPCQTANW